MNALELYLLGKRLSKLAEETMSGPDGPAVPPGIRLIVADVTEHPGTSIGAIAARTGLPQSHVSQSVARLRQRGALETEADPGDGRRTLVRPGADLAGRAARVGSVSVDDAVGAAMGVGAGRRRDRLLAGLDAVSIRLAEEGE